jgi:hypothetical protein
MSHNTSTLLYLTLIIVLSLGLSQPAEATSCTRDCGGECTGGCTINSPTCGTTCVGGGCPGDVTCSEYGEDVTTCHQSVTYKCEKSSEGIPSGPETQGFTVPPQTEWALLQYRTDGVNVMPGSQVRLMASSNARYGGLAIDELVRSVEESRRLRTEVRERQKAQGMRLSEPPFLPAIEKRLHLVVDPAGACANVDLVVPTAAPESVHGLGFFRVTASAGGDITAVSPLYGSEGTDLRDLASWLRQEGRLVVAAEVDSPVEAFLYLGASNTGVSYILGGSKILP